MHEIYTMIAESKIREAIKKGELKGLPGAGKPVKIENMALVPPEERLAYSVLKNSGMVPDEVTLKQEMDSIKKSIAECTDEETRKSLKKKLQEVSITYSIMMEKRSRI